MTLPLKTSVFVCTTYTLSMFDHTQMREDFTVATLTAGGKDLNGIGTKTNSWNLQIMIFYFVNFI